MTEPISDQRLAQEIESQENEGGFDTTVAALRELQERRAAERCPNCKGTGEVVIMDGQPNRMGKCLACHSAGKSKLAATTEWARKSLLTAAIERAEKAEREFADYRKAAESGAKNMGAAMNAGIENEEALEATIQRLREEITGLQWHLNNAVRNVESETERANRQSSELERLQEAIRRAPCGNDCKTRFGSGMVCDCWKSRALSSAPAEQPAKVQFGPR